MKKIIYKLLLGTFTTVACASVANAQSGYYELDFLNGPGNPGGLNTDPDLNTGNTSTYQSAGWASILGPNTAAVKYSAAKNIPFAFKFNGKTVTQFLAASTGYITFDSSATLLGDTNNVTIPTNKLPDNAVCVWGTNLNTAYSTVLTKTFGTAPNRQFWIHFFMGATPTNTKSISLWSIVLEEGTNKIYIVDEWTGYFTGGTYTAPKLTVGIQIDSTHAFQVAGSPNVLNTSATYNNSDNNYYQFTPGAQPTYDLAMNSLNFGVFYQKNTNIPVQGTFYNLGSQTVTSANINYSINGGAAVSQTLTGLSIASGGSYNFTHGTPYHPTTAGYPVIKVWTSGPNGNPDPIHSNDTLSTTLNVSDTLYPKKVLVEEFNQASCDPCAQATPNLDAALDATRNIQNTVRYHVNFPGRDFMNEQTQVQVGPRVLTYYAVTGVPDGKIDGSTDFYPGNVTTGDIQKAAALGSPFAITSPLYFINMNTHSHTITATITSGMALPAGLRAFAAIIDSLHYNANQSTETIPQYAFPEVMEELLPSVSGTTLGAFTAGQSQNVSFTWGQTHPLATKNVSFPYDSGHFQVVIFVQDYNSKFVYQSVRTDAVLTANGIAEVSNASGISIYPNPFNENLNIVLNLAKESTVKVEIMNVLGQKVYESNKGTLTTGRQEFSWNGVGNNGSVLPNGMYTVKVITGDQTITERVNLMK